MDSSFKTYSSLEMAAAMSPPPTRAVPVLVMRFGEEGILLMISDARSEGGVELDELAMLRLNEA